MDDLILMAGRRGIGDAFFDALAAGNDHQMGPIIMHSQTGANACGSSANGLQGQGQCGYGPRLPFLVISPWARNNFVDHTTTDQSSIIAIVESNFSLGHISGYYDQYAGSILNMFDFSQRKDQVKARKVFLDPTTGEVLKKAPTNAVGNEP